ncbi:MAG: 3-oxoacyl-ACP synthase, partial [Phycisphaerae bacterium]
MPSYGAIITGTGSYAPERLLTNDDLQKLVDTNDEWIVQRTGMKSRHIATPEQATSDLALPAAQRAIENAGLTPNDIDMILVATFTPDYMTPSTACILQHRLGITRSIAAMDLAAACSGFVYALATASQFVRSGTMKHVLVIGAESIS